MGKIRAAITGVGAYLPDYILTNDELSRMVDTSDEWIMTRIGIKTRHILKGEALACDEVSRRREEHVGRDRRADDEIDLFGVHVFLFEQIPYRFDAHVRGAERFAFLISRITSLPTTN